MQQQSGEKSNKNASNPNKLNEYAANDVINDLAFLTGLKQRIKLPGNGPRGVTVKGKTVNVEMHFSASISCVEFSDSQTDPEISEILQLFFRPNTPEFRGERYFNDATLCFQRWLSCDSCHPDGRMDGLNWDLLNDGLGNPKNTKSLVGIKDRNVYFWEGTQNDIAKVVHDKFKNGLQKLPKEEVEEDIVAYLKSLAPKKNVTTLESKAMFTQGKDLFAYFECASCHSGPQGTDDLLHDVGTKGDYDRKSEFVTPPLVELHQTAPYMHDGRYATLAEVFREGKHGLTKAFPTTAVEGGDLIDALCVYLNYRDENDSESVGSATPAIVTCYIVTGIKKTPVAKKAVYYRKLNTNVKDGFPHEIRGSILSNENGIVEFDAGPGEYEISLHSQFASKELTHKINIDGNKAKGVIFTIREPSPLVVQIYDAETHKPITDTEFTVELGMWDKIQTTESKSNEIGEITIERPHFDCDHYLSVKGDDFTLPEPMFIPHLSDRIAVNLKRTASITGRMIDDATGQPLTNYHL